MKQLKHLSIRTKLLLILVLTTIAVLLAYAQVSFSTFTKDKVVYVFDSTLAHARATSSLIQSEVKNQLEKLQLILRGYSIAEVSFTPSAQSIFEAASDIETLQVYAIDPRTNKPRLLSGLYKAERPSNDLRFGKMAALIEKAIPQGLAITDIQNQTAVWGIALRSVDDISKQMIITVALFNSGSFLDIIAKGDSQNVYLLDANKEFVIHSKNPPHEVDEEQLKQQFEAFDISKQSFGVKEISLRNKSKLLMSYAQVGIGGLWIAEIVPRDKALQALSNLMLTTGKILVLLIGVTIFISVFFASGLTANLARLHSAVREVTQGNLDSKVSVDSGDEIGDLAEGFNVMTTEIRRLIEQTKVATRMESELHTASVVQSTLFPPAAATFDKAQIFGHYESASECSGDWWNYYVSGSKIYMAIGDATGHGVPAALVTAALRSAFQLLKQFEDSPMNKKVSILNQAIFETMQGKIQMTFFLGCLDQDTGEFTYANASHDPPYLFPFESKTQQLSKKEIVYLQDSNGFRLGQAAGSEYTVASVQLQPGQFIIFTTDGVADVVNPEGKIYGERRLLKILLDSFNRNRNAAESNKILQNDISVYRKKTPLNDDVTFFILAFHG